MGSIEKKVEVNQSNWKITDQIFDGTWSEALTFWKKWAHASVSKVVCFANVHMSIESRRRPNFNRVMQSADMICADGQPLVWLTQRLRNKPIERIAGMDALPLLLKEAEQDNIRCYFYGGSSEMLSQLSDWMEVRHPQLSYHFYSPPFGPLESLDFEAEAKRVNQVGAQWIFVVLGCPKQEEWMHQMQAKVQGVMFGVGGALPVLLGIQSRAPLWMQRNGLEWLFRLIQEPRRMWRRYLVTNVVFIAWVFRLLLIERKKNDQD